MFGHLHVLFTPAASSRRVSELFCFFIIFFKMCVHAELIRVSILFCVKMCVHAELVSFFYSICFQFVLVVDSLW